MTSIGRSRRSFMETSGAMVIAPTLFGLSGNARAADDAVVVGTWGGDYQRVLQENVDPLLKQSKVDVMYDSITALARQTKMRAEKNARRATLDVSLLRDNDMYQMFTEETTAPLDTKLVPNLANLVPQFRRQYSVPHIFSALMLIYSTDKVKTPPNSMSAMLDSAYKGRVGLVDDQYDYLTLVGALASGGSVKDIELGRQFLRELKKTGPKVYPSTDALAGALKTGDIWLAVSWKARAMQWKKAGLAIDYVLPKEGALPATFEATVTVGSKKKEAAFAYLNAMLAPAVQRAFAETMGYAPTTQNAGLSPELQRAVGFSGQEMAHLVPVDFDVLMKNKTGMLDFWNKEFRVGL